MVTVGDHLVPSELAIAAYDKAHEPKKLVILPGGHFDARGSPFNRSWPGHGLVQGRPSGGLSRPVTSANAVRLAKLVRLNGDPRRRIFAIHWRANPSQPSGQDVPFCIHRTGVRRPRPRHCPRVSASVQRGMQKLMH